jgi:hypothetical protein
MRKLAHALREQKKSMLSELEKSSMAKRGLDLTDNDLKKGIEPVAWERRVSGRCRLRSGAWLVGWQLTEIV